MIRPQQVSTQNSNVTVPPFRVYLTLDQAQSGNLHFSFFDKVTDTSGKYKKADGTPYEYMGHWSWIYVYNDECEDTIDGKTVKLFQWMAAQKRK